MPPLQRAIELMLRVHHRAAGDETDRGDVPGWVFVTVMSAALVGALFVVAGERLSELLNDAMDGLLGD
jgi:hypothetical protein